MLKSLPWQSVAYWTKAKILWVAYKISRDAPLLACMVSSPPHLGFLHTILRSRHTTPLYPWKYSIHSYHHVFAHVHLRPGEPSTSELIIAFYTNLPWWCSLPWVMTPLAPCPDLIGTTCICFRIFFSKLWFLKGRNYKRFIFIYSQFNIVGAQWMFVE